MTAPRHDAARLDPTQGLLVFNQHLLEQALKLVEAHQGCGAPRYAGLVGSHLRHVIEHYEALLLPRQQGIADYDARPRDAELETRSEVAHVRLLVLHRLLGVCSAALLTRELQVRGMGGLSGQFGFQVSSTLGRELAFVASHTVHHFALLGGHCTQQGIAVPDGFGKAPATRAHEHAVRLAA